MTQSLTNTYTKLQSGAWGVRAAGKISNGASLTVTKKDGSAKIETVERVLWTGKDNRTGETISLCAIRQTPTPNRSYGFRRERTDSANCNCRMCASGSECLCIYDRG